MSAPRKLRIGLVGLGRSAWEFHGPGLSQSRDFDLVAVADPLPERRREAGSAWRCAAFADYGRMLKEAALDAVTIATPTHLHRAMAEAAFRRGLHVVLEKPMAPDLRDAVAIVRAARRARRVLTVFQPRRLTAVFQQILRLAASGRIGTVYHCQIAMRNTARRDDWQSLKKYGGGMLNNYGAHALDQLLQLIGYDVARVFCRLGRVATLGDAEDVVKIVLETRRGRLGEIDINQWHPEPVGGIEVLGTRGRILYRERQLRVRWFNRRDLPAKTLDRRLASPGRRYPADTVPFREETLAVNPRYAIDVYRDFARAIQTGRPPAVPPEQTLAVMRLIAQCRADSRRIVATPI